jgi:hypothetical protein
MKYTLLVFADMYNCVLGVYLCKKEFVSFRSARIYAKRHNYQYYSIR